MYSTSIALGHKYHTHHIRVGVRIYSLSVTTASDFSDVMFCLIILTIQEANVTSNQTRTIYRFCCESFSAIAHYNFIVNPSCRHIIVFLMKQREESSTWRDGEGSAFSAQKHHTAIPNLQQRQKLLNSRHGVLASGPSLTGSCKVSRTSETDSKKRQEL